MSPSETAAVAPRIGYVLKMYPRFSETFVVNEILALEALGLDLDLVSLRPPIDGCFHESLAAVRAPVTYLAHRPKPAELWQVLRQGAETLPDLGAHLDELLTAELEDAVPAVELAVHARSHRLTHLHAHFGSVATTVARLAARLAGIGYSFTAHAKDIFHESVDSTDVARKLVDARFTVTVSDYNLMHLRRTYGAAADSVVRVYNGLDLELFRFTEHDRRDRTVVGVGRLVEKKGWDYLIDAVGLLAREGHDVRLVLVGSGVLEPDLRSQVDRLGVSDHVTIAGPVPQGRLRAMVSSAGVLAAPCVVGSDGNRDGLPTVLLEGLALGTPCIATPVTGIPEVIRDNETGLLVPERSVPALAAGLLRLLDEPELGRRLAVAGRELVEDQFDVRRSAERLSELFAGVAR